MSWLIRTFTDPGMTVVDPVMGAGSTGLASLETGRSFLGIERDPGYFAIAQRRIAEARAESEAA
jgi:DNA modification methylase